MKIAYTEIEYLKFRIEDFLEENFILLEKLNNKEIENKKLKKQIELLKLELT